MQHFLVRIFSKGASWLHDRNWGPAQGLTSTIKLEEILEIFKTIGIGEGSTIFVHSSWERLNSGNFSPVDMIKMLASHVGEAGTVAMPAFPAYTLQADGAFFDAKKTPSAGGLLTEVFRRFPGVTRSVNLAHSVCAVGKYADFLTNTHHLSQTPWDKFSPYYKLREIDNSWIVGFGVGHRLKVATSLHCVESELHEKIKFFRRIFQKRICYTYKSLDGQEGEHCYYQRVGAIYTPKIAKFFTNNELIEKEISGVQIYFIKARTLIDRALELGIKGRTMYVYPFPFPWLF